MNIRIPVDISENELELIIELGKKYNIAICLTWQNKEDNLKVFNRVKESDIPFYFSKAVYHWDELLGYLDYGVSDIFISGELAFDLARVRKIASSVQLRAYANICQNYWAIGNITDFFIRPEDVDKYSEYIDVLEFYDSEDKQNILYNIYFHDKKWNGDLREIIKGLKVRINNYYLIDDEFANRRIDCQKRCLKGEKCNLCNLLVDFANSLEDSKEYDLFIRRDING